MPAVASRLLPDHGDDRYFPVEIQRMIFSNLSDLNISDAELCAITHSGDYKFAAVHSRRDLAALCLVNKTFNAIVTPLLYDTFHHDTSSHEVASWRVLRLFVTLLKRPDLSKLLHRVGCKPNTPPTSWVLVHKPNDGPGVINEIEELIDKRVHDIPSLQNVMRLMIMKCTRLTELSPSHLAEVEMPNGALGPYFFLDWPYAFSLLAPNLRLLILSGMHHDLAPPALPSRFVTADAPAKLTCLYLADVLVKPAILLGTFLLPALKYLVIDQKTDIRHGSNHVPPPSPSSSLPSVASTQLDTVTLRIECPMVMAYVAPMLTHVRRLDLHRLGSVGSRPREDCCTGTNFACGLQGVAVTDYPGMDFSRIRQLRLRMYWDNPSFNSTSSLLDSFHALQHLHMDEWTWSRLVRLMKSDWTLVNTVGKTIETITLELVLVLLDFRDTLIFLTRTMRLVNLRQVDLVLAEPRMSNISATLQAAVEEVQAMRPDLAIRLFVCGVCVMPRMSIEPGGQAV